MILNRRELLNALEDVKQAGKTAIPILEGVAVTTEDNNLILETSNLEMHIRRRIPLESTESIKTVIPFKPFAEIVKKIPADTIDIKPEESMVVISAGTSKHRINTMDINEFPLFPEIESEPFSIDADVLGGLIKRTTHACSKNDVRPFLTGVFLHTTDNRMIAVATDSFRLAASSVEMACPQIGVILPTASLNKIAQLNGTIECQITENQALFRNENTTVTTRLIEGQFPNYERIIPTEHKTSIFISRNAFIGAVERASILSDDKQDGGVVLELDKEFTVTSESTTGKAKEVVAFSGDALPFTIRCKHRFLLEALKAVDDEGVVFHFSDSLAPMVVEPDGSNEWLQLIMPINMNQ